MPIVIHSVDRSPPARAVLMIAEILKLKYEVRELDMMAGDNMKPEYLEKNPLHTVPMLEDGKFALADSHAIIKYLVSKYGAEMRGELYPNDLEIRATIDQRLFFDATVLFITASGTVKQMLVDKVAKPSEKQMAAANEAYEILEKYLQKTKFVACNYFTLADVACVATVSAMVAFLPLDAKYEKVHAWLNKLEEEEWYQKINVPGLQKSIEFFNMIVGQNSA